MCQAHAAAEAAAEFARQEPTEEAEAAEAEGTVAALRQRVAGVEREHEEAVLHITLPLTHLDHNYLIAGSDLFETRHCM